MSFKFSKRSLRRLKGVHPKIVELFSYAIEHEDCPFDFGIPRDGGLRTLERQKELYSYGRYEPNKHRKKITWTLNSNHRERSDGYGYAVDIFAYVDGKPSWNMLHLKPIADHLKKCATEKNIPLEWGYDLWGKDAAHFQVDKGVIL
jgi:peptidoglycan L-alanyl-D-glutamate endopeptidase CwlK